MEKGKPIFGIDAVRDKNSGAVIYTDVAGYQRAVKRKKARKNILLQEQKIINQDQKIKLMEEKIEKMMVLISG